MWTFHNSGGVKTWTMTTAGGGQKCSGFVEYDLHDNLADYRFI